MKLSVRQEEARTGKKMVTNTMNLDLVKKFIVSIRRRGENCLPTSLLHLSEKLSTPFLTWVYSHQLSMEPNKDKILELAKLDIKRSKTVTGHNIFADAVLETYPEQEERYQDARSVIEKYWNKVHDLIEVINPRVSLQIEGRRFESESNPKEFGQIIYNMKKESIAYWIEILVHEIGHHYLTVLLGTTKMNGQFKAKLSQTAYSHQRDEERPLVGILHAVVAQSFMIIMASKILKDEKENIDLVQGAKRTFEKASVRFKEDLKTVKANNLIFRAEVENLLEMANNEVSA